MDEGSTMDALWVERPGGPEVVQRRRLPVPRPRAGEVRVRVMWAGINFMDIHTRQGKYETSRSYPVRLPTVLGMEGSGVVDAVGDGVQRFRPGDRVAWCIAWGAYAEFACVPQDRLAHVPDGLSLEAAAAGIFQGSTAHYLLGDVARLRAGDSCLVHAASGAIGQLLVQWAVQCGVTVFATASSDAKCAVARRLGAHHAMTYDDGRFADRILSLTDGRGVDVVFDAVGRATLRDSLRATRRRGLVVNYGSVSGSVRDLDPYELGEAGSLFLTRPRLADHLADGDEVQRRADATFNALLDGTLHIPIVARYTLDDVLEAHALIERRVLIGKAVMALPAAASASSGKGA